MSYPLTDWDRAYRTGRRVFFESATLTLRQCPENYRLARRQANEPYHWTPDPDKASTINAHSLGIVLDQHRGMAGEALAEAVEEAFWGERLAAHRADDPHCTCNDCVAAHFGEQES